LNKILFLALLGVTGLAVMSLRRRKVKFEVEFEMEPESGEESRQPGMGF
jgi:hypothetical protein